MLPSFSEMGGLAADTRQAAVGGQFRIKRVFCLLDFFFVGYDGGLVNSRLNFEGEGGRAGGCSWFGLVWFC